MHAILLPLNITRLAQLLACRERSIYGKSAPMDPDADRPIVEQNRWAVMIEGQEEQMPRSVVRLRLLALWREREHNRRELATMSVRDFSDIAVPPGLIREEQARWPWQAMNRGWSALSRDN